MYRLLQIFLPIVLFSASFTSYAEERILLKNIFNKHELDTVLKGGIITKCFLKHNGIIKTPNTDSKISIPSVKYISKDIERYEMLCIEKAFFPYRLNNESRLFIYNNLASPSKLTGMQYYSRTDKITQTLIIKAHRIDSLKSGNVLAESVYNKILPKALNYLIITDNRFGDLLFKSELYNEGDNFILKNTCMQSMEKYFISINKKKEYKLISFFIYDKKHAGYFYCSINAMRIRSEYFLKIGLLSAESFANRIRSSTVHTAGIFGLNWKDKIKAF